MPFHALTCAFIIASLLNPLSAQNKTQPTFTYVLQAEKISPDKQKVISTLANANRDIYILDSYFTGPKQPWLKKDLQAIKNGNDSIILAYISIGEAETYRPYWNNEWDQDKDGTPDQAAPDFLCTQNPSWAGNYKVKFWRADWQKIILSAFNEILQQGFDGAYLDIIDAYEFFEHDAKNNKWLTNKNNPESKQSYRQDMIDWVSTISHHCRKNSKKFLIFPQNGYELLADKQYLQLVDGIGVESLYTDGQQLREESEHQYKYQFLDLLKKQQKTVLTVEYTHSRCLKNFSMVEAQHKGYSLLLTNKELTELGISPEFW